MATFVDGEMTVAEAREADVEDAIARVTRLPRTTVLRRLRRANGNQKLCNLFADWPDRLDEVGDWTAKFALERGVAAEIAEFTSLGVREVTRRLEGSHGKTLVQNVLSGQWPTTDEDEQEDEDDEDDEDQGQVLAVRAPPRLSSRLQSSPSVRPLEGAVALSLPQVASRASMFRRYDLQRARAARGGREPAAHQSEALAKLQDWYRLRADGDRGGILALPTGSGKTFTTVRFLCDNPLSDGYKVLWLAHTHHLLDQALDAFGSTDASPLGSHEVGRIAEPRSQLDVRVVSSTAGHFPVSTITATDDVVIATLQTAVAAFNRGHEKLASFLDSAHGKLVIVFDEAHHAPAPSYCKLLERLRQEYPKLYLLGLTATPEYNDPRRQGWLKKLFPQEVLFTVSHARMMAAKVLSKPNFEDCYTNVAVKFDQVEYRRWLSSYGDLPEGIVTQLAENQDRNEIIAETYAHGRAKYGKTLIFADRWFQCLYLREALRKRNVRADVVYSHVDARPGTSDERNRRPSDENARVLQRFRNDELDVLINVRMLTEGTDVPSVQSVFLTRQTTSRILLTQMVGRALRGPLFGGTAEAHIVSFVDSWKQVIKFADYASLPTGETDTVHVEYGKRPPLQLISIELVRRLAQQMYKGGVAQVPFLTLLPVGWYRVQYETCVGEGDDVVWHRQLVMVFANEKQRYERFIAALQEVELSPYAAETLTLEDARAELVNWQERYFPATEDHPGAELVVDLFQIARHLGQSDGEAPTFFEFEERSAHDVDAIARGCVQRNLGVAELDATLRAEYERGDRFWKSLYSNYGLFNTQYHAAQRHILEVARPAAGAEDTRPVFATPEPLPLREPSEAVKQLVRSRDHNRCCCCGAGGRLEIDHIVPAYHGGSNEPDQLQTLCRPCNAEKAINTLSFRLKRPPPDGATRFALIPFAASHDVRIGEHWMQHIQRTINFFYRCAAVEAVEVQPGWGCCEVLLRPGIDARWIEPHLSALCAQVSDARALAGYLPLGSLRANVAQ